MNGDDGREILIKIPQWNSLFFQLFFLRSHSHLFICLRRLVISFFFGGECHLILQSYRISDRGCSRYSQAGEIHVTFRQDLGPKTASMTRRRLVKVGLPFWVCSAGIGRMDHSVLGTGVHVFIARALFLRSTHGHKRLVSRSREKPEPNACQSEGPGFLKVNFDAPWVGGIRYHSLQIVIVAI